ncbi:MAG: PPC domain-containing DNA-binding protein [Candidatus Saccharimonadales bacterium]
MVSKQLGAEYLLRFDKGELLMDGLLKFVKQHSVRPTWVQGLGAALWAEIGFYDLNSQQYQFKKLEQELEIGSLTGNITWLDGEPTAHLHVVLADSSLQAFGGHLKELAVGGTCEIYLKTFDQAIARKQDEATGLKLLDL